jgi:hypothetical protein
MMRWCRLGAAFLLLGAVLLMCMPGVGFAQLNCTTKQCVEIPYEALKKGEDSRNKYCRIRQIGTALGYAAFSTTYAIDSGYGKESKGGKVGNEVKGYLIVCKGKSHCDVAVYPVSGDASDHQKEPVPQKFFSTCSGKE